MNILSRPGWYIALSLFVTHQIVQYGLDRNIPLIDSYLDPLLCIPIILGVWLTEGSYLYGRPMRIGFFESCVVIIFLALLFEEGFPRWQPAFVRDWWDYLAYAVGGLWFWFFINPAGPEGTPPAQEKL